MEGVTIIEHIREAVGLTKDNEEFDTQLLKLINSATSRINQNGAGRLIPITINTTWDDFKDPDQIEGNMYFNMIPFYVAYSTRILFDPPAPSQLSYYQNDVDQALWRIRSAYVKDNELERGD